MMTRHSIVLVFTCSLLINSSVYCQEHEIGIWGGITHSFGDINTTMNSFQHYNGGGGFFYKYNFNPRISWYAGASFGSTEGYDNTSEEIFQQARNLDYKTSVKEISTRIDFNFFSFNRTKPKEWFTPYVFLGINAYHFNPQGYYQGHWIDLQPLGTEGQNVLPGKEPYHRLQLGVPLGGGLKFALSENWAIGLEGNWHKLFTDYFDDVSTLYVDPAILSAGPDGNLAAEMADKSTVSLDVPAIGEAGRQRGDTQYNDAYFYGGIFISYTIVNLKCPPPSAKGFSKRRK